MFDEGSVVKWPEQRVQKRLEIGIRAQLARVNGSREELLGVGPARPDPVLAKRTAYLLVEHPLGEDGHQELSFSRTQEARE